MGEENTEQRQPTTLERLEAITKRLAGGDAAQAATRPGAAAPVATSSKNVDPNDEFAVKEARVGNNALAKAMLALARTSKAFHHLGADRVLDDPRGYLRQKKAGTDQYVVSDMDLEVMCQTLLAKSADKAEDIEQVTDDRVRGALIAAASKGAFGANSMIVQRALDTTSGAPLIRTDIEPFLYEAYLREFPAAERIGAVRANGIIHTYEVRKAIPKSKTLNNIGDFSGAFTNSTYERDASTRIAILGAPVAISLYLALAVEQSGMANFNLQGSDNLEVVGAITAIARQKQTLLLQGNQTVAAKTLDDEEGLYDALGHDGLRLILKDAATSITKAGGDTYRGLLRRAAAQIRNSGGSARNIIAFCSEGAEIAIDAELEEFYRITNQRPEAGIDTNLSANGIRLGSKYLSEIVSVPADEQECGMGHYTFGGNPTEDIDVVDVTGIKFPYLGSPTPTILELPMGFDMKLARTFVPFMMSGLMVHISNFHRKIRIPKQTV